MTQPLRYHKALITLHWLLAILLSVALFVGGIVLTEIPNHAAEKIIVLRAHMVAGFVILVLTLVRLFVRIRSAKPAPATTGVPLLDTLGHWTHWLLYLLVFAMVASGIALAVQANLASAVFMNSTALPGNFEAFAPRLAHGILAKALMLLIALHAAAALYHQFVRKDQLLTRMWWKTKR